MADNSDSLEFRAATFHDLPDPIVEYILSYLSPYKDLKQCKLVNRTWHRLVKDVARKIQRDFVNAVCTMSVKWNHLISEPDFTIAKRFAHSACSSGNSMYIFGGCTTSNTTFNDLWRFDLSLRNWIRPLATGAYPSPKAFASMVIHGGNLILFGGWTSTFAMPMHNQSWKMFNQLHIYNIDGNRWDAISITNLPQMAGHTATVHGDSMVVFGGLQKIADSNVQVSNDTWILDLRTYTWRKYDFAGKQPPPRYAHSQVFLDRSHVIVIGGCGGPNMLYMDVWLLSMHEDKPWEWVELKVNGKDNCPPLLSFQCACLVGNQIVMLSKAQKTRVSPRYIPLLLRAPSEVWTPPRLENGKASSASNQSNNADVCVNGKRGVLKRPVRPLSTQSSSDEDDKPTVSAKQKPCLKSAKSFKCNVHNSTDAQTETEEKDQSGVPVCCNTPSTSKNAQSGDINCVCNDGEGEDKKSESVMDRDTQVKDSETVTDSVVDSQIKSPAPVAQRNGPNFQKKLNRQRQLEGLLRMELKIKAMKGEHPNFSPRDISLIAPPLPHKYPMSLYVLDVREALTCNACTWRPADTQPRSGPENKILYSLVTGKGELVMFGGVTKDLNSSHDNDPLPECVSNMLHFMSAERIVI